jgi:hypothetical protein
MLAARKEEEEEKRERERKENCQHLFQRKG